VSLCEKINFSFLTEDSRTKQEQKAQATDGKQSLAYVHNR